jgi:hypothetical protein
LLAAFDPILRAQRERVCEGPRGHRETDAVLFQVALGFGRVPRKGSVGMTER